MAQVLSGRSAEWEQCQNHPTKDRKLIFPQPNKWSHFLTKPDGCLLSISRNEHLALHRVVRTQLLNSSAHVHSFDPSFSSRTHSSLLSSYTVLFISLLNFFFQNNHSISCSSLILHSLKCQARLLCLGLILGYSPSKLRGTYPSLSLRRAHHHSISSSSSLRTTVMQSPSFMSSSSSCWGS